MKKNRTFKLFLGILIACMLLLPGSCSVTAAAKKKTAPKKDTWFTSKSQNVYYYNQDGKILKNGKKQIGKKYYYFDKNGIQRTGWQKIGKSYYFFQIADGKKGYMVTSKKVNGITLGKDGKAKLTSYSREKLPILYQANVTMRRITKNSDTKKEKLKKCFDYLKKSLRCSNIGSFRRGKNWDLYYAKRIFVTGYKTSDCYTYGVTFAYLANAVGYKVNAVSSGGHGWAEIGNYVYDPNWSLVDHAHNYFGMKYGTRGSRVPNYKSARAYVITI